MDKKRHATQPVYHESAVKIGSRRQLIAAYRTITGIHSIPDDKQYWTLAANQPNDPGAEIVQLTAAGLIAHRQFVGIDDDKGIIENNQKTHPHATWHHGEWMEVIEDNYDSFNPGFVNFDCTWTAVNKNCQIHIARTMNICPPSTVLAANVMLSDGHSKRRFDPKTIVEKIQSHLRNPGEWVCSSQYFPYCCSRTEMGTFVFWKP
jgi:hypothetical protein